MVSIEKSKIDQSVNFIEKQLEGFLESRYVRKCDDYFICYLSSASNCNHGCKFCHLSLTGQTVSVKPSDIQDYQMQCLNVFRHYREEIQSGKPKARICHVNFMARGDLLSNPYILENADKILLSLANIIVDEGLIPKFNASTIFPRSFNKYYEKGLENIFKIIQPTMYYSIYSVKPEFRKKWLPDAMEVERVFDLLKRYQAVSKKVIKMHGCFIKGENDSIEDLDMICSMIEKYNLSVEWNVVRYNVLKSNVQGEESPEDVLQRNQEYLDKRLKNKVQTIIRVGPDVYSSCGQFVPKSYNGIII